MDVRFCFVVLAQLSNPLRVLSKTQLDWIMNIPAVGLIGSPPIILAMNYWPLVIGYWLWDIGYWVLAMGNWWLAIWYGRHCRYPCLYTLHLTLYALHPTLYTDSPAFTLYTLRPTLYTDAPAFTLYALRFTLYTKSDSDHASNLSPYRLIVHHLYALISLPAKGSVLTQMPQADAGAVRSSASQNHWSVRQNIIPSTEGR